jgi:Fungal Zn(2)-Cys(6) binuclear cluster domain
MDVDTDSSSPNQSVQRIARACERCRHKHVRCSGHTPCIRCQKDGEECIYGYPRGARKKSILTAIDEHNNSRQDASQPPRLVVATGDTSTSPQLSNSKLDVPMQILSSKDASSVNTSTRSQSREVGFDEQENEDVVCIATDSSVSSLLDVSLRDQEPKQRLPTRARARKTRISSACLECKKRRRKVCSIIFEPQIKKALTGEKCTGETPCQTCELFRTECIYDFPGYLRGVRGVFRRSTRCLKHRHPKLCHRLEFDWRGFRRHGRRSGPAHRRHVVQ